MKPLFDGVENANQTQLKPIMIYNHDIFLGGGVKNIYPPPLQNPYLRLWVFYQRHPKDGFPTNYLPNVKVTSDNFPRLP